VTDKTVLEAIRAMKGCPNPDCDGKGTVCLGEYQHDSRFPYDGQAEAHLEQCQWCDEKQTLLGMIDAVVKLKSEPTHPGWIYKKRLRKILNQKTSDKLNIQQE
jgi:hypothetical protein